MQDPTPEQEPQIPRARPPEPTSALGRSEPPPFAAAAVEKAAAPPPEPAAEPAPEGRYGLALMVEDTLCAPFRADRVFASLAERPVPSYAVMIPNLLAFCLAAGTANFVRSAIAMPSSMLLSPSLMAVAAGGGLLLAVPLSFVAAGILHAFMLLAGGEGGFQRSYQATSMLAVVLVLQSLLNWFSLVWALPALLAAYLAVVAARTLHRAQPLRAAAVFGLLAAFAVAGQWWGRLQLARWSQAAKDLRNAAATAQELSRQMQQLQQMSMPLEPQDGAAMPPPAGMPDAEGRFPPDSSLFGAPLPQAGEPPLGQDPRQASGLDLLSQPSGGAQGFQAAQMQAQAQAIQQATSNMLGPLLGMLNNPALTKTMKPEQAAQMKALMGMLGEMQKNLGSGKPPTAEQRRRMQATMMQMMGQMQIRQLPADAGKPRTKARKTGAPAPAAPSPEADPEALPTPPLPAPAPEKGK